MSATHKKFFPAIKGLVQNRQVSLRKEKDPGGRMQMTGKLRDKKGGGAPEEEEMGLCEVACSQNT